MHPHDAYPKTLLIEELVGAGIGDQVKFAGDEWTIVGRFDAGGSGFDSEMWGDATQLLLAFHRGNSFST